MKKCTPAAQTGSKIFTKSQSPRIAAFVDELPKMFRPSQSLILAKRHFRAEQKIRKCSLVQYTMDDDRGILDLKIKPVILRPIAAKHPTITLDPAKSLTIKLLKVLPTHLELIQELQLLERPKARKLGRADLVEHNLQHAPKLHPSPGREKPKEESLIPLVAPPPTLRFPRPCFRGSLSRVHEMLLLTGIGTSDSRCPCVSCRKISGLEGHAARRRHPHA